MISLDTQRLQRALETVRRRLLDERMIANGWLGELSSSALSTATATFALVQVDQARERQGVAGGGEHASLIERGLRWLAEHANDDGGWGDTRRSHSNLSTTTLCWAALGATDATKKAHAGTLAKAEAWLLDRIGSLEPGPLAEAVTAVYGNDLTFSAPILTMCALSGRLGPSPRAWKHVKQLPFELAALPRRWFKFLGLPVVSYALPALIAVGQVHHHMRPSRSPPVRLLRNFTRKRTLEVLEKIQPENGGFLEATPLTSFVTMSLAASGWVEHSTTRRSIGFLVSSARDDGSWPIDTNLATWVTTLAVNALAVTTRAETSLAPDDKEVILASLLRQQYKDLHPYTHAAPGGWAWTDLPGGVPDADDTAGALLALRHLGPVDDRVLDAAVAGVQWLLDLQNRDGGIPTFCRGWGKLPFDRSGPDLTAHALRAWHAWKDDLGQARSAAEPAGNRGRDVARRLDRSIDSALAYLGRSQGADGEWVPLWFGNQDVEKLENPTYGTARVLAALRELAESKPTPVRDLQRKGADWLVRAANGDGGWGGAPGVASTVEETALAVEALSDPILRREIPTVRTVTERGAAWLLERVEAGGLDAPTPIGFYFAFLWYFEKLYPLIFTAAGLGRLWDLADRS